MNRNIEIDFGEQPPPVEILPVTACRPASDDKPLGRRRWWRTWQIFRPV